MGENGAEHWLMDEVQAYAAHLIRDRRRSVHTVRAYVATAERLSQHLGAVRVPESLELRGFLAARRADGLCNASAARELSAVRNFIEFIAALMPSPRPRDRASKGACRVRYRRPKRLRLPKMLPGRPMRLGFRRATGQYCCCYTVLDCGLAKRLV